jgi:ADP-heptose:LPS heptosyltransferase
MFLQEMGLSLTRKGVAKNDFSANSASSAVNRILVIQLTKMGDLLQTTPLLQHIRKRYPHAQITALIDSKQEELSANIPYLDRTLFLDLASISEQIGRDDLSLLAKYHSLQTVLGPIKRENFDLIYNINFSRITALLCQFFPTSQVVGYRLSPRSRYGQILKEEWVSFIFHLMRNRNLIRLNLVDLLASYENDNSFSSRRLYYGKESQKSFGKTLSLPDGGRQQKIGLQLGCGGYLRRWPVPFFASLAHRLATRQGTQIILFGGKGEEYLGTQLQDEWVRLAGQRPAAAAVIDRIGKTSLPQLAEALKECDLLVSADTGTMHLATAVGTRVLALFLGTALCHETGPYGEGHFAIQAHMPCFPCSEGACPNPLCQQLIRPGMVAYLVSLILEKKKEFSPREFLGEGEREITSHQYVQVYRSEMDQWGVKFLPLIPRHLEIDDLMAAVYREVGRKLMDPTYPIHPESLFHELSRSYRGITDEGQERIGAILRCLEMAQSLCQESAVSAGLGGKIGKALGSLEVLAPLEGFFQDLEHDYRENCSTKTPYEAISTPLKSCIDILTRVYHLSAISKPLPTN